MKKLSVSLSKTITYILRHATTEYNLKIDDNGWVNVYEVLKILRQHKEEWNELELSDLFAIIEIFPKNRLEIQDNAIRALYGHSIHKKINKVAATPPHALYHGTSPAAAELIFTEGLKPMDRQYVHLAAKVLCMKFYIPKARYQGDNTELKKHHINQHNEEKLKLTKLTCS
jgi:putative RNA 2'-phosphotransferase